MVMMIIKKIRNSCPVKVTSQVQYGSNRCLCDYNLEDNAPIWLTVLSLCIFNLIEMIWRQVKDLKVLDESGAN